MSTGAKGEDYTQFIVVGAVGLITLGGLAYCFLKKGDKKEEVSDKDLEESTKENKHTEHKDTKRRKEKKNMNIKKKKKKKQKKKLKRKKKIIKVFQKKKLKKKKKQN